MKKKMLLIPLTLLLVISLVAIGCPAPAPAPPPPPPPAPPPPAPAPPPPPAPPPKEVYTFTFAWDDIWGPLPRQSQILAPGGWWQRELYKRSDGRIQLNIISKMFDAMEILAAVGEGKADMGNVPVPWMAGTYPLWNWHEVPGLLTEDAVIGLAEELSVYEDPRFLEILDKTYREVGAVFLWVAQWEGGNALWTNKRVTKLEDMKGLKTRTYGYMPTLSLKALGGSPISMPVAEIGAALLAGTVDAGFTSTEYGYAIGLHDVAKYITIVPITPAWPEPIVMNAEVYDALPPDLQEVITDVSLEAQRMVHLAAVAQIVMARDAVKVAGVEIIHLPSEELAKMRALLEPIEEEWLKVAGPYGPEALAIAKDVIAKYRAFEPYPK